VTSVLHAIAAYSNPFGNQHRRYNLVQFARALQLPLLVVEIAPNGVPYEAASLLREVPDVTVFAARGDLIWQKERAYNLGLAQLPAACDRVLLVDVDFVFPEGGVAAISRDLDRYDVVQAFRVVQYEDCAHEIAFELAGVVSLGALRRGESAAHGGAWAFRRGVIPQLFEGVLGEGDLLLAGGVFGAVDVAIAKLHLQGAYADCYRAWATTLPPRTLGFVDLSVRHLWHGSCSTEIAAYDQRSSLLQRFVPSMVTTLEGEGLRWSTDAPSVFVRDAQRYLTAREV
jgi:hypothetical protein